MFFELFILIFVFLIVSIGILLFFLKDKEKRDILNKSLKTTLFLITIPSKTFEEAEKEKKQEKKEWISIMEHFYSTLTSFKKTSFFDVAPWISFEIAKVKENIYFYVSVPERFEEFVEKEIYSIQPDAQVERVKDFNIFDSKEVVSGAYLKFKKPFFLPIVTYRNLEEDPLNSITNTLTNLKLKEEAVIQIVLRNISKPWQGKGEGIIKRILEGKSFSNALSSGNFFKSFFKSFFNTIFDVVMFSSKKIEGAKEPTGSKEAADEELIKALRTKINKDSFETNIRIICSTEEEYRSEEILSQIGDAFAQFSAPKLNEFKIIRIKDSKKLKKLIYNYSFRIFNPKEKMILGVEELASIFHFPTPFLKTHIVKILKSKKAPPPLEIPKQGILLGHNEYHDKITEVRMTEDDRRKHFYIVGQTGTGKSVLLSNLALQDIVEGKGVCVMEPHGDLIEEILGKIPDNRIDDVVLFDPTNLKQPVGLNMLEYDPQYPEQKTFIINELIGIFEKLYDLKAIGGAMFEQYTRNALLLLMDDPAEQFTIMEVPRVLADKSFRDRLLFKCKNIIAKNFWEKEAEKTGGEHALANLVPWITSKFNVFIANDYVRPIIGQERTTINFREIMDEGKILLVNLSKGRLGEISSSLLGLIITGKLAMTAFSRIDIPEEKRKDFYFYMDEFQNFCTGSISTILSEARKYRLCLIIAHQFIKQLPDDIKDAVFGNVGTISSFRVGPEDAEFLVKQFEPVFSSQDLIHLENFSSYIKLITAGKVNKPFNMRNIPPTPSDTKQMKKIQQYSSLKYGREIALVNEEIRERLTAI